MAQHFIFVAVVTLTLVGLNSGCRPGWHALGSKCYMVSRDLEHWGSATAICKYFGGHLAEIHSADINNFLVYKAGLHADNKNTSSIFRDGYWIGLNDIEQEGTWIWSSDLSTINADAYKNWAPTQPDNGVHDENCMYLSVTDSQWYDGPCGTMNQYYICEIDNGSGGAVVG